MKRLLLTSCFAAAAAFAGPAGAAVIVDNSIPGFSSITWDQGIGAPTGDPNRDLIANMFDGDPTGTFLSLGRGGTLTLLIDPATNRITSALTIERTNTMSVDQEAVSVFLGIDGANFVKVADFFNNNLGASCTDAGGPADCSATPDGIRTQFSLFNIVGNYNTLRFVDVSLGTSSDGFDVAELTVATTAVPEPASLALLGAGLLGLGMAARRRSRKAA